MLLQSKNPQPRPNSTRNETAVASVAAFPTPNIAGMIIAMPRALT